ncbi:MAG: MFS transporter, partial [Dongiaceae bacterium]
FLPLYGTHSGLDEATAVTMLTVLLAGTTIIQLPLGWLADRLPVRHLLIGVTVVILLGWAAIPAATGTPLLWPTLLLLGCAVGGLWTVSLILVGERFEGADIAAANTARSVLYGLGAFGGPALAGVALELWDPHGVPLVIIVVGLLFLPVALFAERPPRG